MAIYESTPPIVTNGLVLALDAANKKSYVSGSTIWNDLSGNGYNGTLTNGPTYSSTNGGSIVFDGSSQYVTFTYSSNVAFLNRAPYTLEVFARAQSISSYPGFINRESTPGSGRDGYNLIYTEVGVPAGQVDIVTERFTAPSDKSNVTNRVSTTSFFNNWHHIVSIYDGSNLYLYYDGIFINSASSTGNITNTSKALEISVRVNDKYKGNLSVARIYNRALSSQEVLQNYNALKNRFNLT
jgi:Concanavalin A-like lectin/glucanases superfamily